MLFLSVILKNNAVGGSAELSPGPGLWLSLASWLMLCVYIGFISKRGGGECQDLGNNDEHSAEGPEHSATDQSKGTSSNKSSVTVNSGGSSA